MFWFKNKSNAENQRRRTLRKQVSLGLQKLDERKLMAADFGGFGNFIGPQLPHSTTPAIVSSAVAGQNANLNGASQVSVERIGNVLHITGTQHDDVVNIKGDSGLILMTAMTTDELGNEQTVERYYSTDLRSVNFDAGDGDDYFKNLTLTHSFVEGGDGDDFMQGRYTNHFFGGAGDDELRGQMRRDILFGGEDNDRLFGGGGNDVLYGDGGADQLYGGWGNDDLYGGTGVDRMYGSSGNDEMYGGDHTDYMYGGSGNDEMYGQSGRDHLWGGRGNDTMFGGLHNDKMRGEDGHDVMLGQDGRDTMWGGIGNDRLDGGAGDDFLLGEAGNDMLFGRGGQDGLYGGANNDHLDGGDDGIQDLLEGEGGRDVFIRHVHIISANDPDQFVDVTSFDSVFRDYGYVDVDGDFPTPKV